MLKWVETNTKGFEHVLFLPFTRQMDVKNKVGRGRGVGWHGTLLENVLTIINFFTGDSLRILHGRLA